jgi:protein phosphatase
MNEISKVFSYSGIGKRSNNEDSYSCSESNFFLVCDGVGGAEKGEVASSIVTNEFSSIFNSNSDSDIEQALRAVEYKLTEHINAHPESMGMATTLTFSQLRNDGLLIAWVGDSRVYQFREGKIIFQTTDHSWVNDALRAGMITEEEAVNHPKSNIITRAVQGEHKPVEIDFKIIKDLKDGDFIFQCSDGVLEAWSNEELEELFGSNFDGNELLKSIELKCADISRDNNTAILYQIKSDNKIEHQNIIDSNEVIQEEIVEAIPVDLADIYIQNDNSGYQATSTNQSFEQETKKKVSKFKFSKPLFFGTLILIFTTIYISSNFKKGTKTNNSEGINKSTDNLGEKRFLTNEKDSLKNNVKTSKSEVHKEHISDTVADSSLGKEEKIKTTDEEKKEESTTSKDTKQNFKKIKPLIDKIIDPSKEN